MSRRHVSVPGIFLRWAGAACAVFFLSCDYDYLRPASVPFTVSVKVYPAVYIHDTLEIRVSVPEPGVWGVNYVWSVDSSDKADTTRDSVLKKVFSVRDTGMRRIVIKAIDGNGTVSPEEIYYVNILYYRPGVALRADTVAFVNVPHSLRFKGYSFGSRVAHYSWFIDDPQESRTTADTLVKWIWDIADTGRRTIVVRAVDLDGISSRPCTLSVRVIGNPPSVILFGDTTALINRSYSLTLRRSDADSNISGFAWFIDDPLAVKTTLDTLITWVWRVADTGRRIIVVRAFDRYGLWSAPCSLFVNVGCQRPAVALYGDAVSFTGALYTLRISGTGGDTQIDRFVWYCDDSLKSRTTVDTLFTWAWGTGDSGIHVIGVYAVDLDGITSEKTNLSVAVLPGAPIIAQFHDTMISSSDTLTITCLASDPNGIINKFLWDFNGGGWDDSTDDSSHLLWYCGNGTVPVTVGVRDNDDLVSTSAFTVTFNRPPDSISVSAPAPVDTLVFPEKRLTGAMTFTYRASDPDNDPVVYSLLWRAETDTVDSLVYRGPDQSFLLDGIGPGRYFWRLEARDPWGHTRSAVGTVVVIIEHSICFIGHSIVAGVGGSDSTGGFRAGVLDSLRKIIGPFKRVKPTGPLTSNYMVGSPADDSCMAIGGIKAKDLYSIMTVLPSLTADVWVLMIGVNDLYNPQELSNTILLMENLYYRNPAGRIYVLNGNQIGGYGGWLPSFNQGLHDAIAARTVLGMHLFEVDAYTALSDSSGNYDTSLFTDGLHPNVTGYGRLVDAVFSTMKSSVPPVISSKP